MKIRTAEFVKGAVAPEQFPRDGFPQVAFAGRSNVGKSSLINSLVNRKNLARTSRTPGRTQEINFFLINGNFFFVDLPGFGYAKVPLRVKKTWDAMITRCLVENPALKMVVFILDARRIPSEGDKAFIKWLEAHRISYVLVVTKSDKLSRMALLNNLRLIKATLQAPEGVEMIPYSARTLLGREKLLEVLGRAVRGEG